MIPVPSDVTCLVSKFLYRNLSYLVEAVALNDFDLSDPSFF